MKILCCVLKSNGYKSRRFNLWSRFYYFSVNVCFICGIISFGCSSGNRGNPNPIQKTFSWDSILPLEKQLSGKKFFIEELKIPNRMLYKNNKLLITDSAPGDTFVHVLDGNSLEYLFSTVATGYGPGEIPDAWAFESGLDPDTFWVYSLGGKVFSEYALEDFSDSRAINQFHQKEDFFLAAGITWASDSSFMTILVRGEDKFVEFNTDGTRLESYGKWKGLIPGDFEDHVIADLHQGRLMGDPKVGKFIKTSIYRDHLEILDRKSGQIIEIDGPENSIPEFQAFDVGAVVTMDHPVAYLDAFLGKAHLFGLYSGKTEREINEHGRGETDIFVFDHEGNLKAALKLDIPIRSFTVDEDQQRILGITTDKDPGVVVFRYNFDEE